MTFELCSRYVDEIVTVDDDEIAQAILFLMERGKMVAEGAGAAPVAAIMNHKFDVSGKVVAVISGGNIDVTMISRIIEKGLLRAGRVTKLRILMQDRPGQLEMASRIIAAEGANVMVVHHDRTVFRFRNGAVKLKPNISRNRYLSICGYGALPHRPTKGLSECLRRPFGASPFGNLRLRINESFKG